MWNRCKYTILYHLTWLAAWSILTAAFGWGFQIVTMIREFSLSVYTAAVTAVFVILSAVTFSRLVCLFRVFAAMRSARCHREDLTVHRVTVEDGAPRVGKTLSMTEDLLNLAAAQWWELLGDYYVWQARAEFTELSAIDRKIMGQVTESVEFYIDHPDLIPLLWTNYGIECNGQRSSRLEYAHIIQAKKLPEGAVLGEDEGADDYSNDRFRYREQKEEKAVVNETFSKIGHYNYFFKCTEQDKKELHIGLRRVVGLNRTLYRREELLRPLWLMRLRDRLRTKIIRQEHCTERQLKRLTRLERLIGKIGFYKIFYIDYSNTQTTALELDRGSYVLPLNFPYRYETRAYRFDHAARDKAIEYDPHKTLYVRPRKPAAK